MDLSSLRCESVIILVITYYFKTQIKLLVVLNCEYSIVHFSVNKRLHNATKQYTKAFSSIYYTNTL
jgi:hypothetical protein